MLLYYLIFIFFIFLVFLIIYNKKYEYFDKLNNGLLCGTKGNVCSVYDEYGKNSCCNGFKCIRPNGDYLNKICVEKNSGNNLFDGIIALDSLNNGNNNNNFGDDVKSTFKGVVSDIESSFSGLDSYFSGLKIDLGNACKK